MAKVLCLYCMGLAEKVTGATIYPHRHDLAHKTFYLCRPCNAYVGCHPGTDKPLGRLANAELRVAKQAAHAVFDPIWKAGGMTRHEAYRWLAGRLGIEKKVCHIGMMDVETCGRVVDVCREVKQIGAPS